MNKPAPSPDDISEATSQVLMKQAESIVEEVRTSLRESLPFNAFLEAAWKNKDSVAVFAATVILAYEIGVRSERCRAERERRSLVQ